MKLVPIALVLVCACASAKANSDAAVVVVADGAVADGPTAATPDAITGSRVCPGGQVATGVSASGYVTCQAVDGATAAAVRSACSVYLGQRDKCDGCSDPPAKWVASSPTSCSIGVGTGNACVQATLDDPATPVELAALDLDGDVNGDDKLYTTLHCATKAPPAPQNAPCPAGWAVNGKSGDTWTCAPISDAALGYVRSQCAVYFGWQDQCNGCTSPPTKWGVANDSACTNGAGGNDTCVPTTLDGQKVNLFGLNTDGDVDGNDKIHFGFYCTPGGGSENVSMGACPSGEFVVSTNADGSFQCASPAPAFASYVGDHCTLFFGWHGGCDACTQPPAKWGAVSSSACNDGGGVNDTCTTMTLGKTTLPMFGLNPDSDVDADDTFYIGLRCDPIVTQAKRAFPRAAGRGPRALRRL